MDYQMIQLLDVDERTPKLSILSLHTIGQFLLDLEAIVIVIIKDNLLSRMVKKYGILHEIYGSM
jgi:hypothetical protein